MFALPPDVKSAIATQNDLVRADLPSRFASITLVSLLSLFFVPIPVVATIYLVYGLIEIIGVYVYKRLSKEVTIGSVLLFAGSAFAGVWVFNAIPLLLFLQSEPFPKLMGSMLLIIALNHSVVARSAWMFFGILTAVPILCVFGYMIGSFLYNFASPVEIVIATIVVVLGSAYMLHAMWVQHRLTGRLREACAKQRPEAVPRAGSLRR